MDRPPCSLLHNDAGTLRIVAVLHFSYATFSLRFLSKEQGQLDNNINVYLKMLKIIQYNI